MADHDACMAGRTQPPAGDLVEQPRAHPAGRRRPWLPQSADLRATVFAAPVLLRRSGRQELGRRRNELLHARLGVVPAHVVEPEAVDARVLVLVLDLVAAFLHALGDGRLVAL